MITVALLQPPHVRGTVAHGLAVQGQLEYETQSFRPEPLGELPPVPPQLVRRGRRRGAATQRAVEEAHGGGHMTPDGRVGPQTWSDAHCDTAASSTTTRMSPDRNGSGVQEARGQDFHRTGSWCGPRMSMPGRQLRAAGCASSARSGQRSSRARIAIRASMRASGAPRQ